MSRFKIKQVKGQTQGSILFIGDNGSVSEDFNKINWNSTSNLFTVGNLRLTEGAENGYILMSDNDGIGSWTQSNIATQSISEITLTGVQDGVNKDFTMLHELTYPNNLFFINGQLLTSPSDYIIDGFTLSLDESRQAPLSDDILRLFGSINDFNGSGVLSLNNIATTDQFFAAISSIGNINLEINSSNSTHEFDANINFNDSGTSSNDVWSADKIIDFTTTDELISGDGITISNDVISIDYLEASDSLSGNGLTSNSGVLDVNVSNGLELFNDNIVLGGLLNSDTILDGADNVYDFRLDNMKNLIISSFSNVTINDNINGKGLVYGGDYELTFVTHSLVDKNYVENKISDDTISNINGLVTNQQSLTSSNDDNILLDIISSGSTHSFNISWQGLLPLERGGLSNSTFTQSQILITGTNSVISSGYNFNDSGTSSNDVWSANQTINYIQSLTLEGGRNALSANNIYLRNSDGLPFNTTPFILPYDGKIKSISISTSEDSSWTGEVRSNGTLITGASIIAATSSAEFANYDINIDAGSKLQLYCNGEAANPKMVVTIIKR